MRKPRFLTDFELLYSSVAMEIRFDDELTCRFALEVEWSTATHVSVVSQRGSECQTLLQNGQFISELRKGTKPVIRLWQEKVFICYFRSFQNFSMKSNCLTLGQKSPKSLIATAAILVVRTARGAGATSLVETLHMKSCLKSSALAMLSIFPFSFTLIIFRII